MSMESREKYIDAQLANLTAKRLNVNLGEPVSQLSETEMRAYSYALKWGFGLVKEDREKRLELMKCLCETGVLPDQTDETLSIPGAISLLPENDQKQIRRNRAISAVRETIKGIAPQFLRHRDQVPDFFMEGYRCAINGGERQVEPVEIPIEPETAISHNSVTVFEKR